MSFFLFSGTNLGHTAEKTKKIIALGDSLTAGYGLDLADSFPVRLQIALEKQGHTIAVENAGVSGDTTKGGLERLDWALGDTKPDLVIVALGANDGLRGIDPAHTRENLDAIIKKLTDKKIPVLLAGMIAPPNLGTDYGAAFNKIYPELATQYGLTLYPFFLEGVVTDPALNQSDGIHPNPEGVKIMVEKITPYVLEAMSDTP